jgi:hypothetical protein
LGNLAKAKEYFKPVRKLHPEKYKVKVYADFFAIMDRLAVKLYSDFQMDLQSFINNFPSEQTANRNCDRYFNKILKLVKSYEDLSANKDLMIPEFHEFHFRISDMVLEGTNYLEILVNLHDFLKPTAYLEIGVETGRAFKLAGESTISIGVDPKPQLTYQPSFNSKVLVVTSDEFFQTHDILAEFKGNRIDLAFIDGLHLFEQTLKDFVNVEKYSSKHTVVCFHDTLPLDEITSRRECCTRFWTGDVWKIVPILKEYRPDLKVLTVPTTPAGLTIVTNLDPSSQILPTNYEDIVH